MNKIYSQKNFNTILYNLFFAIISIIFISYFIKSFFEIPGGTWAFNELFINYSAGIIRRGLLGSIFLNVDNLFEVKPLNFFSPIFTLLYSAQMFLFYKLLKKFKNYHLIYIPIIFSPALMLFSIYDQTVYFTKDIFTNITILLHCFYLVEKRKNFNIKNYNNFLLFLLIPIISLNILNHENQFFFVGVHLLLTSYTYSSENVQKKNRKYLYYIIVLLPLYLVLFKLGNWEKIQIINDSIEKFGVKVNDQLAGNMNLAIGGFIKWHFIYHDAKNFINLFVCLILSLVLFFIIFHYFIKNEVFEIEKSYKKKYLIYFIPALALFVFALDHGRNINLILTHLIAFYLVLNANITKMNTHYSYIINNFFLKSLIIAFLFFYVFLWYLPQGGGYSGIGLFNDNSSIIKNSLFNELTQIFMIIYDFIDLNIIKLPRIIV